MAATILAGARSCSTSQPEQTSLAWRPTNDDTSRRKRHPTMLCLLLLSMTMRVQPFYLQLKLPPQKYVYSNCGNNGRCTTRDVVILRLSSKSSGNENIDDEFLFTDNDDSDDGLILSDSSLIYGNSNDVDDDGDEDDDEDEDPYAQTATSEFTERDDVPKIITGSIAKALTRGSRQLNTSPLDWGGELSTLRSRVSDIEEGRSTNPSTALFRSITRERPNEAIGRFVREANPEVVAAMTGAVSSLLGNLSNPSMGIEIIVQASGEKLANLCFQLMMTGYMFRNAEYVIALKSLMNIQGEGATLEEYRAAFSRMDTDGNGYLERHEIEAMLAEVYDGKPPAFEITTFLEFFDSNNDGRISWEEFEKGFALATKQMGATDGRRQSMNNRLSLPGSSTNMDNDDDDDENEMIVEPAVSGTVKVELDDGRIIEVDAQEYMNDLKKQALEMKKELARLNGNDTRKSDGESMGIPGIAGSRSGGGIAGYISSLQGDVKSLTQGISPEVVESMKMLIDYVLEGGPEGGGANAKKMKMDKTKEMELPGSALQQLALWQLVIGYRLRETEATGDWRRMLE